jgi:uncharacterized RDD family membrane protein YckC
MTEPNPADSSAAQPPPAPASATAASPDPAVAWPEPARAAPVPAATGSVAFVYADVPNRIIAYVIDIIMIVVLGILVGIILGVIGLAVVSGTGASATTNWLASLIFAIVGLAISGGYFVYFWKQRATIGMRVLGLQIGTAGTGVTVTTEQAVRRWLALGAIFSIAQTLNPLPFVGLLIGLAAFAWVIFLLLTTWRSPTKQGWHDVFADTAIVKATRSAA